jgi:hypothetical protein
VISIALAVVQIAVGAGFALFSVTLSLNLLNRLIRAVSFLMVVGMLLYSFVVWLKLMSIQSLSILMMR